jgi:hypothetical protein
MNLVQTIIILAGGPGSGRHKELLKQIEKNPSGKTKIKDLFKVENAKISNKLDSSEWGVNGYDEGRVGKKGTIDRNTLLNNLWVTAYDSKFQSTVDNNAVRHFMKTGFDESKMREMDRGVKGPIRLVEFDGKYYLHDGRHRLTAAILRGDDNVPVHIWKLKKSDFEE